MSDVAERIAATSIDSDMLATLHDLAASDVLSGDTRALVLKILNAELRAYWDGLPAEWRGTEAAE